MNLHDEIAKVAYELYEKSGHIKGRDLDHWLAAEIIVLTKHASQEMEEPEEATVIEEIEMEGAIVAEEKGVTEEAEESEETTVVEEIEVKGTMMTSKGKTKGTEKIKPAIKTKTVKEGGTKGKKETAKKAVRKVTKKTSPAPR
jgi:hypothetical protein